MGTTRSLPAVIRSTYRSIPDIFDKNHSWSATLCSNSFGGLLIWFTPKSLLTNWTSRIRCTRGWFNLNQEKKITRGPCFHGNAQQQIQMYCPAPPTPPPVEFSVTTWLPSCTCSRARYNRIGAEPVICNSKKLKNSRLTWIFSYFFWLLCHVCYSKWTRNIAAKSRSESHGSIGCTVGWRGKRKTSGYFVDECRSGVPVSGLYRSTT